MEEYLQSMNRWSEAKGKKDIINLLGTICSICHKHDNNKQGMMSHIKIDMVIFNMCKRCMNRQPSSCDHYRHRWTLLICKWRGLGIMPSSTSKTWPQIARQKHSIQVFHYKNTKTWPAWVLYVISGLFIFQYIHQMVIIGFWRPPYTKNI